MFRWLRKRISRPAAERRLVVGVPILRRGTAVRMKEERTQCARVRLRYGSSGRLRCDRPSGDCPCNCPCQLPKPGFRSQQQPNRAIEEVMKREDLRGKTKVAETLIDV